MIQMAGRGLRTVDPELYPGGVEKDCLILDFGASLLTHGNLDQDDGLHQDTDKEKGEASMKTCPSEYTIGMSYHFPDSSGAEGCGAEVPTQTKTCPICGFTFERIDNRDEQEITGFDLTEIDILNQSPFLWQDVFNTDMCLMASGFAAWAGVFSPDRGETWVALGEKQDERRVYQLARTGRMQALSASDDFLRNYETDGAAKKSKRWLNEPATPKQVELLNKFGYQLQPDMFGNSGVTKYMASCITNFFFNRSGIERLLGVA